MASITFAPGTVVPSTWLNDVNVAVYNTIPTLAPIQSPNLITPNLGTATASSINKVAITPVASGATLTLIDGNTATVSNTNTGDQLTFKTVMVAGQPTVTATTITDNLNFVAGVGAAITTDAATNSVTFTNLSVGMQRFVRTSNTQLVANDNGKLFYTNSTYTQTFDTPANLGNGWKVRLQNGPSGQITIPSSDGLTNWIMYPNEIREFISDGTALYSNVLHPFYTALTTTGTFTTPPGYTAFAGHLWGGGGSGARSGSGDGCGGGGGGACVPFNLSATALGASQLVTVAAGGAVVVTQALGNPGGTSSIGSLVFAYGGGGGGYSASNIVSGGAGGGAISVGSNGSTSSTGALGGAPFMALSSQVPQLDNSGFGGANTAIGGQGFYSGNSAYGGAGGGAGAGAGTPQNAGSSVYGGAGGGGVQGTGLLNPPGTSVFGGAGGAASSAGNGVTGVAPAGGGGATRTGTASGAGGRGECRIWGIA